MALALPLARSPALRWLSGDIVIMTRCLPPPGRGRRAHAGLGGACAPHLCRSGGTGRRAGLKIRCHASGVGVQFPPPAPRYPAKWCVCRCEALKLSIGVQPDGPRIARGPLPGAAAARRCPRGDPLLGCRPWRHRPRRCGRGGHRHALGLRGNVGAAMREAAHGLSRSERYLSGDRPSRRVRESHAAAAQDTKTVPRPDLETAGCRREYDWHGVALSPGARPLAPHPHGSVRRRSRSSRCPRRVDRGTDTGTSQGLAPAELDSATIDGCGFRRRSETVACAHWQAVRVGRRSYRSVSWATALSLR